jgi:hypothetical protein
MRRAWIAIAAAWALIGSPVSAQQQSQPRDPFNGQFGVFEVASRPAEAARLAKLMGDALDGLAPQRPGEMDVYLITASLWGDPVFEREATQAETILREHFDVESGRSIVLSAGGQAERLYPAATPNNIAAAIGHVGATIDPNEDLVVIFLTSHGQPDGAVALRETNRLGAAMRPTHLREMLSLAGIRNRVVIVSACFSGAFIAPLMDANTIVLTAAAPDRTSFGCQPEREWTFFGDAYFNHALRSGSSMVSAFDQAKTLIERWEREQNMTPPSNPQRYVGPNAAEMVRRAEAAVR